MDLKLYDVKGRLLKSEKADGGQVYKTSLSKYASGVYLLKIQQDGHEIYSEKIIQ